MTTSSSESPIVSFENVGVYFKRRSGFLQTKKYWALHDVSFEIHHGETLGVIGNNGAGKSTLLKLIAGVFNPDCGKITNDSDYTASLLSLQAGFVPHLSGRQNAILSGMLLGMSKEYILSRIESIIGFSELHSVFDLPVITYSSGMKARLGFGVAIQANPDILLIDEILGVGDIEFKKKSSEAMHNRIQSDRTVVLVSHHANIIRELCDRVVWISEGRTKLIGTPDDIIDQYIAAERKRKSSQ